MTDGMGECDECAACGRTIGDAEDCDRPRSRFARQLCNVCGVELQPDLEVGS